MCTKKESRKSFPFARFNFPPEEVFDDPLGGGGRMGQGCFTAISSNRTGHRGLHCSQFRAPDPVHCLCYPRVQWLGLGQGPSLFHCTRVAIACWAIGCVRGWGWGGWHDAWLYGGRGWGGGAAEGGGRGLQRSGLDPPLSSSCACLHMAFIASSVPNAWSGCSLSVRSAAFRGRGHQPSPHSRQPSPNPHHTLGYLTLGTGVRMHSTWFPLAQHCRDRVQPDLYEPLSEGSHNQSSCIALVPLVIHLNPPPCSALDCKPSQT